MIINLFCEGSNNYDECNIPLALRKNILNVSAGIHFTCTINLNLDMNCYTYLPSSDFKIPSHFRYNIQYVSSRATHVCALNSNFKIACLANDFNGETLIPKPYEYANQITTGIHITCIVKINLYSFRC